jgi:hypothetical protein
VPSRRRAASIFAEALQVALADGLELACVMAMNMAENIRTTDPDGARALMKFAETATSAKDQALARADQRRERDDG